MIPRPTIHCCVCWQIAAYNYKLNLGLVFLLISCYGICIFQLRMHACFFVLDLVLLANVNSRLRFAICFRPSVVCL